MIGSGPVISADRPLYLDANILIYAMETDGENGVLARRWLIQIDQGHLPAVTSEMSIVEVLPHPISERNTTLVDGYRNLLTGSASALRVIPIGTSLLLTAARLRAELGCATPDAIHVATALDQNCAAFLTNDDRLKLPDGLMRHYLPDVMSLYR